MGGSEGGRRARNGRERGWEAVSAQGMGGSEGGSGERAESQTRRDGQRGVDSKEAGRGTHGAAHCRAKRERSARGRRAKAAEEREGRAAQRERSPSKKASAYACASVCARECVRGREQRTGNGDRGGDLHGRWGGVFGCGGGLTAATFEFLRRPLLALSRRRTLRPLLSPSPAPCPLLSSSSSLSSPSLPLFFELPPFSSWCALCSPSLTSAL